MLDLNQIQQIFINTLHNARDALTDISNGKINVSVTPFKADKKFNQRHDNNQQKVFAQLSIEDNGCGIPQADLEHKNDVKIMFSTGYDKTDMLDEEQIGHYPLISKPYNVNEFSQLIKDTLLS
ncbi:MAG: hypothetical protein GY808_18295 [Gammaproteobacteria bacterium]|nr:hypothetical protein [Gammaproteobacteria bacterium]